MMHLPVLHDYYIIQHQNISARPYYVGLQEGCVLFSVSMILLGHVTAFYFLQVILPQAHVHVCDVCESQLTDPWVLNVPLPT